MIINFSNDIYYKYDNDPCTHSYALPYRTDVGDFVPGSKLINHTVPYSQPHTI